MRTYGKKNQGNYGRSIAGPQSGSKKSPSQHLDNRPEAVSQRKLQQLADNSHQASQLKAFGDLSGKSALKEIPSSGSRVIQGYFEGRDLSSGNVPADARVSENLKIVKEGKQDLYADPEKIKQANNVLGKGSRVVLEQGDKKDYDLESAVGGDGLRSISFTDFYQVVPRYNPAIPEYEDDVNRDQSPEAGSTPEETEEKHRGYVSQLIRLRSDFGEFLAIISGREGEGLRSWTGNEWFPEVSKWLNQNPVRNEILRLGLMEIAAGFMLNNDRLTRNEKVQALFLAYNQFMKGEIAAKDKISLPTDCASIVREIVSNGKTVENDRLDDNPDIGSNYYTDLPANASNVGWNFHWGGVILKDGGDNVTLESAGGTSLGSMGKQSWWFQMYGTKNVDQTFKKQIHQTHIDRNRNLVDKADPDKKETSHEQLDNHQDQVNTWTGLDSDRK